MDCAAREGIQFSDSNGVRRLPAAKGSKKPTILVVDDEVASGQVLSVRLKLAGFRSSFVSSGEQALGILAGNHVDAVLADLNMPGFSGLELLTRIRRDYPSLAFLLLLGRDDAHIGAQAIKDGADDYLLKPVVAKDVLRNLRRALDRKRVEREALELQKRLEQLVFERTAQLSSALQSAEESYENTLLALGAALDLRDGQTADDSRRVCEYSLEIARRMGCSEVQLKSLSRGALLHDIGTLAIPDSILSKPGKLTPEEWNTMRGHVQIGYDMVSRIPFLRDAADLVLSHHERYDGTGYPRGLQGEQIPLSAKIFAVADAFDAMTSPRPYQATRRVSQAIEEIALKSGRQFDPQVVQTFLGIPQEVLKEIYGEQKERTYGRPAAMQTEMKTSGRIGVPVAVCG
jgi:response regulator RpfG family c-di-GMP phosphodiesterase